MKSRLVLPLIILSAAACSDSTELGPLDPAASLAAAPSGLVMVTNSADDGPGSLRAAVALANSSSSIRTIQAASGLAAIHLVTPIELTATQSLSIKAKGLALDGSELADGESNLLISGGGDLDISDLIVRNAPDQGMEIQIPSSSTGTKRITLTGVVAENNSGHGIEINDQEDPEDQGDPDADPQIRGNSNGSAASLVVSVVASRFDGNGFGALDRDGLRVNEGGIGTLTFSISRSTATGNGADGVELDERGDGGLGFEIMQSHFTGNGDYDQSAVPDKDDGFDADELDAGDFVATVRLSSANDNFEEGFDFNENDAGLMNVFMIHATANGNPEEGIDLEEDDDFQGGGDLIAWLEDVVANGNVSVAGDGGIKIRERGDGALVADVLASQASDNVGPTAGTGVGVHIREQGNGDLDAEVIETHANGNGGSGMFFREDDNGNEVASVTYSQADANGTTGIDFDENNDGNLTAIVSETSASNNTTFGIRADESSTGSGTLTLTNVAMVGNGSAGTTGNVPPTP